MPDQFERQQVGTMQSSRQFIQQGGPGFSHEPIFAGLDSTWVMIGNADQPEGDVNNITMYDAEHGRKFVNVGTEESPPDLPSSDITFVHRWSGWPSLALAGQCALNVYHVRGLCRNLSDPHAGWQDAVTIYSDGKTTSRGRPGTHFRDDTIGEFTRAITWRGGIYDYIALSLAAQDATGIATEVTESVFWNNLDCGDCGPINNGTNWRYSLLKSTGVSPATSPRIRYSVDDGQTWASNAIDGIGATEDGYALRQIGNKLVVFTRTGGGVTTGAHYYSTINPFTGVPGAWTKVTSGYVAGFQPTDVTVSSGNHILISADNGYIYGSENIATGVRVVSDGSATAEDLSRIHSRGNVVVAVGAAGTVLKSVNRGATFAAMPAAGADNLTAVAVVNQYVFWVGDEAGSVLTTETGGESWLDATSAAAPGATAISDIKFSTPEVGNIAYVGGGVARLATTFFGGAQDFGWTQSHDENSRVANWPTFGVINRIAMPTTGIRDTDANALMLAGLAAAGTDGVSFALMPILN